MEQQTHEADRRSTSVSKHRAASAARKVGRSESKQPTEQIESETAANVSRDAHGKGRSALSLLNVDVADALLEQIVERAAELLARRVQGEGQDGWLRGAERISAYIDCPRSRVYALASARRIPVHHDGSALIARRSELDRWLRTGGGCRT